MLIITVLIENHNCRPSRAYSGVEAIPKADHLGHMTLYLGAKSSYQHGPSQAPKKKKVIEKFLLIVEVFFLPINEPTIHHG